MWKYFKLIASVIRKCCKSSNINCNTYTKVTAATRAPYWCCQQIYLLKKVDKMNEWKNIFFYSWETVLVTKLCRLKKIPKGRHRISGPMRIIAPKNKLFFAAILHTLWATVVKSRTTFFNYFSSRTLEFGKWGPKDV